MATQIVHQSHQLLRQVKVLWIWYLEGDAGFAGVGPRLVVGVGREEDEMPRLVNLNKNECTSIFKNVGHEHSDQMLN